ncbi:uncharacterized protein [Watersipora subatra]|uniref:uncharacterized protein n=1 Tax=Watersipora subatra TaxID=2589382 RepID=UPI00355C0D94
MSELSLKRRRSGAISGSERITGVKNAQADVLLLKKKQHYDFLFKKKEQDIQTEEHRLENESKLLNLESKRNELEYKRRLYPDADLSNDEMTVNNLQKYLVRNAGKLNYTDKSLENKVRIRCSTDTVSPIVAEARTTITKKELMRAVEKNRKRMYNFLEKPISRQNKRHTQNEEIEAFEKVVEENTLPGYAGHLMPDKQRTTAKKTEPYKPTYLALPAVQETAPKKLVSSPRQTGTVKLVVPQKAREKQEFHKRLKDNPIIREAMETHQKDKVQSDLTKPSQSVAGVLSRMSKKKPPTKSQVQEEAEVVQNQVGEFCDRIEGLLWEFKEEQFRQGIKFVKDKDAAWNKFMETMKKRNRTNNEKEESDPEKPYLYLPDAPKTRRPTTSIHTEFSSLTEKQREIIMVENLKVDKERLVESAPTRKRGVPHHTIQRSFHHSPRAKLQRMLEKNKNILDSVAQASQDKQEPGATELIVATKQSQIAAL